MFCVAKVFHIQITSCKPSFVYYAFSNFGYLLLQAYPLEFVNTVMYYVYFFCRFLKSSLSLIASYSPSSSKFIFNASFSPFLQIPDLQHFRLEYAPSFLLCMFILHLCVPASLDFGNQQQECNQHTESVPQPDSCQELDSYQKSEAEDVLISKLDSMDKEIVECEEDIKNLGQHEVSSLKIVSTTCYVYKLLVS